MRLAKLTLSGFKSFADRTEFTFEEAVTGVVGPNGCGKSNIVDSIKWVLGERSSKSLRGKEMIDVIFAGSAGRKPAGMASVALTFENPLIAAPTAGAVAHEPVEVDPEGVIYGDNPPVQAPGADPGAEPESEAAELLVRATGQKRRALPVDSDIVEVERRLYRDGNSQYLINGKRARLKDIRDLFLDTGIGADAYSIIEQGKVDAMLLASPQERRTIFEEAAGIAKYKQRRIEAQRKLEKAQSNLALTREQLQNTERRLRMVKGQAVKARKFKELDAQLRASRMALALDQYDDIRRRLEGLTSSVAQLEGVRAEATETLATIESQKQEAELARHELTRQHRDLEEQRLAARHAEQSASQRRAMTERALEDARRQAQADAARLADLQARIAELAGAAEEQRGIIAAAAERLAEAERQLEAAATERAGVQEAMAEKRSALAERRAAAANIDRERTGLLASIQGDERREEALREQARKTDERRAAIEADHARLDAAREAARAGVATRRDKITELEGELIQRDQAAAALSAGRRDLAGKVSTLEHQYLKLEGRRATLQEMDEARVGLGDAVRAVLAKRDAGEAFKGVIAPLADLIETDRAHASAVEAALGVNLQALVIDSIAALPPKDELAALGGRVVFAPLAGIAGSMGLRALAEETLEPGLIASGRITPLRAVVRLRAGAPDAGGLLDRLLGGTYLVEDLDSALILAAAEPGARLVTRDGSVMEPDGRILAGPVGASDQTEGVLQRRGELSELTTEVARLAAALESERESLKAVDAEAAALSDQQHALRTALAAEQRGIIGEQTKLDQLGSEIGRLERDRKHLDEEAQQLATRLAKLQEERARLKERAERLRGLHEEQTAAAVAIEEELKKIALRAEAQGEQITALRVETSRLGEQLGAARREARRLELAAESADREGRDLSNLVAQANDRQAEHERAIEEASRNIAEAGAEAQRLEAVVAEAAAAAQEAAERASELGENVNAARTHAQHVERDWHSLEVARRELEVKRENLEERTSQELELDLTWEYADYRRMMESGGVMPLDQEQTAAEIEALRDQVKKLGSVNLDSIEEETQLEARNEELIKQVADIDDAAAKLAELIERLNVASKERFGEVFTKIQEHFAGSHGMFRKLFGGGKAEVRLMPLIKEVDTPEGTKKVETDEVDLLESGIEVIAKPPGKEPRSISQLSGGEKTLTAVALLLSIFQSKPSCFCILDEVDAALDDANVGRYIGVVREFTSHSHFIVITHNKKTMQGADRLYGITMQERGVSTRVSVKFEQVGKDGTIKTSERTPSVSERASSDGELLATNGHAMPEMAPEPKPVHQNGDGDSKGLLRRALAGMREQGSPVEN